MGAQVLAEDAAVLRELCRRIERDQQQSLPLLLFSPCLLADPVLACTHM